MGSRESSSICISCLLQYFLIKSAKHPMSTTAIANPISAYITANDERFLS